MSKVVNPPIPENIGGSKCCLYVLLCADDTRYVGRVENEQGLDRRFDEHKSGKGSSWTQLHAPIKIEKRIPDSSLFHEDSTVLELMCKHGVDRVSGGSYSQIILSAEQNVEIQRKIRGATNGCFVCGSDKHFAADCKTNKSAKCKGTVTKRVKKRVGTPKTKRKARLTVCAKLCTKCGRNNHVQKNCYAKTHLDGTLLGCPARSP